MNYPGARRFYPVAMQHAHSGAAGDRPGTDLPAVSVIVPVYNHPEHLARCVAALLAQDYRGPVEILIVDNGSDPPVPEQPAPVRVLREPRPGSYRARNTGLESATGAMLAFTDADCVPHAGWLSAAVDRLTGGDEVDAVGGQVRISALADATPSVAELYEMAVAFPQQTYVEQASYAATANLVVHRATIGRVGPFDATLRSGGDFEWGQRLGRSGGRLVYCADAVVDHPARTHEEMVRKIERTTGGARDRDPSWRDCVRFSLRFIIPPRKRILAILAYRDIAVPPQRRARAVGYAIWLNWLAVYHRLRLQLRGRPSAR